MPITGGSVMDESAAFLNDPSKSRFTYAVMTPMLKRAWKELQLELHLNDVPVLFELTTSITVAIGNTSFGGDLPSDIVEPIQLEERNDGSSDDYAPMERREYITVGPKSDSLLIWAWREEVIEFLGANTARDVRMRYLKSMTPVTDENTALPILDSDLYLAPKVASYVAKYIGENFERGRELDAEARSNVDKIIRRNIKKRQRMTARRRSFSRWLRGI
jgi:hypothetical protein